MSDVIKSKDVYEKLYGEASRYCELTPGPENISMPELTKEINKRMERIRPCDRTRANIQKLLKEAYNAGSKDPLVELRRKIDEAWDRSSIQRMI